jgi:AraC-like DNA-binding protein
MGLVCAFMTPPGYIFVRDTSVVFIHFSSIAKPRTICYQNNTRLDGVATTWRAALKRETEDFEMFLLDLISSVNHALPRLVAASAEASDDEPSFAPHIRCAFLQRANEVAPLRVITPRQCAWESLQSGTVGILGADLIATAAARTMQLRYGCNTVGLLSEPANELDADAEAQTHRRIPEPRAIMVVLPWPEDLSSKVGQAKFRNVEPDIVLVLWRRSLAIERALVHLGQHYDEQVRLHELAEVAGIDKFHLVRRFAATLGVTPHRYQLLLRVSRAKAMLREGLCVTQIAHGVGFADHSHMDRSFRVLMGMTPTEYRRSVVGSNVAISF